MDDLLFQTIRHRPEELDVLARSTNFSRKEIQILYRGFKQVRFISVPFHVHFARYSHLLYSFHFSIYVNVLKCTFHICKFPQLLLGKICEIRNVSHFGAVVDSFNLSIVESINLCLSSFQVETNVVSFSPELAVRHRQLNKGLTRTCRPNEISCE